jgi:hypothetical protein
MNDAGGLPATMTHPAAKKSVNLKLNDNIRPVVDLYTDLSSLFATSDGGGRAASDGRSVGTVRQAGARHKRIRSGLDWLVHAITLHCSPFSRQACSPESEWRIPSPAAGGAAFVARRQPTALVMAAGAKNSTPVAGNGARS